jgi:uncharacterized protein YoxC
MVHGSNAVILIILVYFIIVVIVLTIFYRIARALDQISAHLKDMSRDLKAIADRSGDKK